MSLGNSPILSHLAKAAAQLEKMTLISREEGLISLGKWWAEGRKVKTGKDGRVL